MSRRRNHHFIAAAATVMCSLVATNVSAFVSTSSASLLYKHQSALSSSKWLPKAATDSSIMNRLDMLPSSSIEIASEEFRSSSIMYTILHTPTLWSVLAMTSIVALLVLWEETVHNSRSNTPKPIRPVIDSMLAEVGGLG